MKNLNKAFKWGMVALIVISVVLLIWGFAADFKEKNVDILLGWAYVMIALALVVVVIVGLIVGFKNNPKSIVKLGIGILAIAALSFIVYLISPGSEAMGMAVQPDKNTLKLTDTLLNLTYITGVLAILSIIVGEIAISVRNKK